MIIRDWNLLKKVVAELRREGKKIAFTNGIFDIIHKGHVVSLSLAKKQGDVLIVGINSDESTRKRKGDKRPIIPLDSRIAVLDALKPVDIVVPFDEETPVELIKVVKPDVHVKGGDYTPEDMPETKIIKEYGGEVKIISSGQKYTTSEIIESILNKYK